MMIENDQQFKQALSGLSIAEQRSLAGQFIDSVAYLNPDPLIARVVTMVRKKIPSSIELDELYNSIKSLAVKTYTACGGDANWSAQAAHFVATASKACLTPVEHLGNNHNLAWKCAMQTRMANNCEMIDSDSDSEAIANEAQKQYAITRTFINTELS